MLFRHLKSRYRFSLGYFSASIPSVFPPIFFESIMDSPFLECSANNLDFRLVDDSFLALISIMGTLKALCKPSMFICIFFFLAISYMFNATITGNPRSIIWVTKNKFLLRFVTSAIRTTASGKDSFSVFKSTSWTTFSSGEVDDKL